MPNEFLLIFGMFLVTFTVRWFLLGFARSIEFPAWFKTALTFVPVAVLTSIFIPIMLLPQGEWWLSWQNPYLLAGVISACIAWRWQNLLLTIVSGLAVFIGLKFFLL